MVYPEPFSKVQLGSRSLGVLCSPLLSSSVSRDLAPRDISGTSDPFARVFWGSQSLETSVSGEGELGETGHRVLGSQPALSSPLLPQTIKKTRFPHWDEVLELREMPGAPCPLRVELWDWDMVGKNDFLGMVSLPGGRKGRWAEYPGAQTGRRESCLGRSRVMESYCPLSI